ncbi:methyltransferase, FkbM family [Sulfitobacter brevis]|uniref:Methyltransferase, FkbM family n=1 Tax=Sulfitobacter brevis TaxID=74348 RepID=A0A1I1X064_9RHOB|nr:FkbM family methyltransferase [Sulfitobacter brevis]SFE00834.1 methyltransferase, FkbM family [Sulfitobacter brevis]
METAAAPSAFSPLGLKHRIATSGLAGPVGAVRGRLRAMRELLHPELALLYREDAMMDAVLERLIQPDWNCLDVGAHLESVFYKLTQLAPKGTHAMVEASPGKAQMLRGRVVERRVAARRLDDLLGPDAQVDFIKIDVEGFEFPALRGAEALLRRCRPLILFEAGAVADTDIADSDDRALFEWLTQTMGYDIYATFDLYYNRRPITADQFNSYRTYPFLAFNYFALSADKTPTQRPANRVD